MAWAIEIDLKSDRNQKGTLKVYNGGNITHSCDCLGRGDSATRTDWWTTNADTPTGTYDGTIDPAPSGTSYYPLRPTNGCIRVTNDDQKKIADLIVSYGGTGYVGISGPQKEKP